MDKHKQRQLRRLIVLSAAAVCFGVVSAANLFSLQIIHGDEYLERADQQYSYTRTVSASRGEILDRNGTALVSNSTMYVLTIDYAMWPSEEQNEEILKLAQMVRKDSEAELNTSLPIASRGDQFVYTAKSGSSNRDRLARFCEEREWGEDLSAAEVMQNLCELYDISIKEAKANQVLVASVRYQMTREQFSMYNSFTMATNLSMDLVTKLAEQHLELPGVSVSTRSERQINTTVAGNILGYTGAIFAEDWEEYSEKGYSMDATVGKTGAEKAFEEQLRGKDGTRTIQTDSQGNVISEETTEEAESGNTVMLTIDAGLQELAERSLASRCQSIAGAEGGAAVVIDVSNGEILALANYPTYNPQTFQQDIDELNANPLSPQLNRCIASTYAPGSTFKPCTAVAGLEEGVIDGTTAIYDYGVYTYYDDYQPKCWYYTAYGTGHGSETVVGAIEDSCNYFFYEVGRLLGGKKLEKYAKKFGLGRYTGIELSGERKGTAAGPTERAEAVEAGTATSWTGGDALQSAIGQGDNNFTPLQLANYCAALANGGTVHSAHLLKELRSYDGSEVVEKNDPEDISTVKASDTTWQLVHEGMAKVTGEDGTAATVFENYSIPVAGKSGTAQRYGKQDSGLFISYAPYTNPEIAVCVVIEGGDSGNNVAPVVRDIYDYYFYGSQTADYTTEQNPADSEQIEEEPEDNNGYSSFGDWISGLIGG